MQNFLHYYIFFYYIIILYFFCYFIVITLLFFLLHVNLILVLHRLFVSLSPEYKSDRMFEICNFNNYNASVSILFSFILNLLHER